MLLDTELAVFDCADHPPVIRLLDLVSEQRHEWRPTLPVADAAERFVRENAPNTRALVELVQKCLVEAASPAPAAGTPVRVTAAELRQLVDDLQRPAVVVVEDALTDGDFLLAVARAFGRSRVVTALSRKWLVFAHAGGVGRMRDFVAMHRADFSVLGQLRVAAVLDSDRSIPRQRTRSHDFAEQVAAQGCAVHVWELRHVESYVPTVVWLRHFPDQDEKIGMLLTMRPDQRGYIHMKRGLGVPGGQHLRDLPAPVRQQWSTGLKMPARTPLVPEDLPLSEADFAELGDDVVAELCAVLAMIERIL